MANALAESTQRSYSSAKRRYLSFCSACVMSPIPTGQSLLCRYVPCLANAGLAHSTIKSCLAAVRLMQIENGRKDSGICDMAKLVLVLRGVKMTQAATKKVAPRQPITVELLRIMKEVWSVQGVGWDQKMLWAAASLCFCRFLRSGEITIPSDGASEETRHLALGIKDGPFRMCL